MIRPFVCGVMVGVCGGIALFHLPLAALTGLPALRNAAAFTIAALAWLILAAAPRPGGTS